MLQALSQWKSLFWVLTVLLIAGVFMSRHLVGPRAGGGTPSVTVSSQEATEHIGARVEVCGEVVEVVWARGIGGRPTFINFGDDHPNQHFTALIWGEDRAAWTVAPEEQYADREICVTGTIEMHEGTPQIIVSSPQQIQLR